MTAERQPLSRWRYPAHDVLIDKVFPSGKPPFGPFPTISNVMNASLCPVAIYHNLLHGIGNALVGQYSSERRGDHFQKFIAHLKSSIRSGTFQLSGYGTQAQQGMIQSLFTRFSRRHRFSIDESSDIWRLYVSPWVNRKLESGELQSISASDQIFFELSVSNYRVTFPLGAGKRNYPLRGRIDEVDLTKKRIIERTIKGESSDTTPPLLKDYQVWLLWKILCSLDTSQLPESWSLLNFGGFDLVVETPYADFVVPHDNQAYVADTHFAYSWINDIGISESPGISREVYEHAACSPIDPHTECGYQFIICFPHNYPYPTSRSEIKQTFKPWYRLLLWEQLWEGHLFQYQLLMLDRNELKDLGLISESKIISLADNRMELEVTDESTRSIRGYDDYTVIPFGTLFCGKRINATRVGAVGNRLIMQIQGGDIGLSNGALLLPLQPDETSPIMREPLVFLKQQTQTALLRLQNSGVVKPESARIKSLIQLLEGVFGMKPLRRGP